jgi:hypothetical protein
VYSPAVADGPERSATTTGEIKMVKPVDEKRELTIDELDAVNGGAVQRQRESNETQQSSTLDRRKSGLDNIQKVLDIVHGLNPKI